MTCPPLGGSEATAWPRRAQPFPQTALLPQCVIEAIGSPPTRSSPVWPVPPAPPMPSACACVFPPVGGAPSHLLCTSCSFRVQQHPLRERGAGGLWQLEGAWVAACGVESLAVKRASDACKSQPPAVSEIVPQPQLVDRTLEHIRHLAMLCVEWDGIRTSGIRTSGIRTSGIRTNWV